MDESEPCFFCGGDSEAPYHRLTPKHLFWLAICQLFRMS